MIVKQYLNKPGLYLSAIKLEEVECKLKLPVKKTIRLHVAPFPSGPESEKNFAPQRSADEYARQLREPNICSSVLIRFVF